MPKKNEKPWVVQRRVVGLQVYSGCRAPGSCHVIYEELLSNGSTRMKRGGSLHSAPGFSNLNGPKKQRDRAWACTTTPDMGVVMRNLGELQQLFTNIAQKMDEDINGIHTGFLQPNGKPDKPLRKAKSKR